jgi:hypothetical protein
MGPYCVLGIMRPLLPHVVHHPAYPHAIHRPSRPRAATLVPPVARRPPVAGAAPPPHRRAYRHPPNVLYTSEKVAGTASTTPHKS